MPETTDVVIKLSKTAGEREILNLPDGALQAQHEEMPEGLRLEPVIVLTVSVSAVWLIERIVDHYLLSRENGVVIDLSGPKPEIENFRGVGRTLIIKNSDGQVDVIQAKDSSRASLIGTLQNLL